MLQQEPQGQSAATPTAQIRVTAEELAQAINALEASKEQEAQYLAGTVAIGQVVDELKLEATPEEVWAQVQKQRARLAEETSGQAITGGMGAQAQGVRLAANPKTAFRPRRRWRGKWWAFFGIGCAVYGIAHVTLVSQTNPQFLPKSINTSAVAPVQSAATVKVTGNNHRLSYVVHGSNVSVSGDNNRITLNGQCLRLNVSGSSNTVRVIGTVRSIAATGKRNKIHWTQEQPRQGTTFANEGNGNEIGLAAEP